MGEDHLHLLLTAEAQTSESHEPKTPQLLYCQIRTQIFVSHSLATFGPNSVTLKRFSHLHLASLPGSSLPSKVDTWCISQQAL